MRNITVKLNGISQEDIKWKPRKVIPAHARTRVEVDKSKKIPRKEKYKHINISGE